jgi:predicted enzyme related to lactoylglutathione lyase
MTDGVVLVLDTSDPETSAPFWSATLGYHPAPATEPYIVLVPDDETGGDPELVLQRVPEPKTTKNRMHLDIRVTDLDGEVARLQGLGARRLTPGVIAEGGVRWVVMADPEGNEFCLRAGDAGRSYRR